MTKQRTNERQQQIKDKLVHAKEQFAYWDIAAGVWFVKQQTESPENGYCRKRYKEANSHRWQWCKEINRLKELLKESGYIPVVQ